VAGAIHDQELMFDEHGLGNYRTQTSGSSEPQNGGDEMNQENNQIVHVRMVAREEDSGFWPVLEFARDRSPSSRRPLPRKSFRMLKPARKSEAFDLWQR
jgi:hypothetical protein